MGLVGSDRTPQQPPGCPDQLGAAIRGREEALRSAKAGRHLPEEQLINRLESIGDYLGRHISLTKGPDGLLAMVDEQAPHLLRRAQELRDEQGDLQRQVNLLRVKLIFSCQSGFPEIGQVYGEAEDLLRSLRNHQEHSANLVFEAFL